MDQYYIHTLHINNAQLFIYTINQMIFFKLHSVFLYIYITNRRKSFIMTCVKSIAWRSLIGIRQPSLTSRILSVNYFPIIRLCSPNKFATHRLHSIYVSCKITCFLLIHTAFLVKETTNIFIKVNVTIALGETIL